MKAHILSDLHLEFGPFIDPEPERDLIILAGDIHVGTRGLDFIQDMEAKCPTVFVPGNHEYYDGTPMEELHQVYLEQIEDSFLQMYCRTVNGVKIAGCTLWTDMDGHNPITMLRMGQYMNDYWRIRGAGGQWRPDKSVALHDQMVSWLESVFPVDIVATHHAPSLKSIAPRFAREGGQGAYVSDLDSLIKESGAKLWVHGHTHASVDYRVGSCRVVSNSRGYVGHEVNPDFDPAFVVEI